MVNIDIRKAGEEMQSLFCMKNRQEFWEILDAAQRIPLVLHLHLADMMVSR